MEVGCETREAAQRRHADEAAAAASAHEDESLPSSQSPTKSPEQFDDFLTIVPKPTLLSKEKAKKRLRAFNLTKLNAYYNTKKKDAVEAAALAATAASETAEKKAKTTAAARETVEAIEQCKLEQVQPLHVQRSDQLKHRMKSANRAGSTSGERKRRPDRLEVRRDLRHTFKRSRSPRFKNRAKANARNSARVVRHHSAKEHGSKQCKTGRKNTAVKESKEKDREKTREETWSDVDESFMDHPVEGKEISSEIVDVSRMLLFQSGRHHFQPFAYTKLDGSSGNVSAQYLRQTMRASPSILFSPNPAVASGAYFQRSEVFAIISKPQKDSVLSLIAQAAQEKPIAPSKALKTRNWYSSDYLVEQHAHESIYYDAADLADVAQCDAPPKKAKKRKKERGGKRKRHKEAKGKRADAPKQHDELQAEKSPDGSSKTRADVAKQRKRTDSHKSDTNSINSIDSAHTNNVSSRVAPAMDDKREPELAKKEADPQTPPLRLLAPPSTCTPSSYTPKAKKSASRSAEKNKTERYEHAGRNNMYHVSAQGDAKQRKEDAKERVALKCKNFEQLDGASYGPDLLDHKSYSKKAPMISLPSPMLTTPTKIYKIKNDCNDCIDKHDLVPPVQVHNVHNMHIVLNDEHHKHDELPHGISIKIERERDETADNKLTSISAAVKADLLSRFEKNVNANKNIKMNANMKAVAKVADERPCKQLLMEKLKTKPSELYSPTLQSLPSDSSNSVAEMPDTNEYKSHWETDEETVDMSKSLDNAWESEDEEYPVVIPREVVKPKGLHERSLEMPLNISFRRQRSNTVAPPPKEVKLFDDLDGAASWDVDLKNTWFELKPDVNLFSLGGKPNLEDEYSEFMSSLSVPADEPAREHAMRAFSSSSSSSTSTSSSSTSSALSSEDKHEVAASMCTSSEVLPTTKADIDTQLPLVLSSPVCNVDSTSSPAIVREEKDQKLPLSPRKPLPAIVLAKKSPLVGCKLFKDEDSDAEQADAINPTAATKTPEEAAKAEGISAKESANLKRSDPLPRRNRLGSPGSQAGSVVKHYSRSSKNRRRISPKRDVNQKRAEPIPQPRDRDRRDISPRREMRGRSPLRAASPRRGSPRRTLSPRRGASPPRRVLSPRRGSRSPRRGGSPRRLSPRRQCSPPRMFSPRLGSPKRALSPKPRDSRDSSPRNRDLEKRPPRDCRRREGSPRQRLSPRRRSPKRRDGSRSPKHDAHLRSPKNRDRDRSPRPIDLPRQREYANRDKLDAQRNRDDRFRDREHERERDRERDRDRDRDRDRKYRDGSPRYRESPGMFSPSRRRSPPRHRYSPKRDRSPRYRDRSPRRRSLSPTRKMYSRSTSKERKHESITQALHRLAGMEYDPPKSPGQLNSPMDAYIRGVPDSTISDEQLLQNRSGEFSINQSPVYFNPPFKPGDGGPGVPGSGSPKRIPLDDRINQVLGIEAGKRPHGYSADPYYNQMYYDQYGNAMRTNQYDQSYKHYNQQPAAANNSTSKVLQVGNVLQVVPTDQQQHSVKKKSKQLIDPNHLAAEMPQKFVSVGNMLEIVPTAELPTERIPEPVEPTASAEAQEAKLAEDLLKLRTAERKAEREKRRQDRDRRRKDKEGKRKEREQRKQHKIKMRSEAMIKKALLFDGSEEVQDEPKAPAASAETAGAKLPRSILVVRRRNADGEIIPTVRFKKAVKFADGILPGEGTSPSGGEELSSPPPFAKVLREKRYTKTKRPKKTKLKKKKIKVKIVRARLRKAGDPDYDGLPPPSPPPGSPPSHVYPPRVKRTLINPAFFPNFSFSAVSCTPFRQEAPHGHTHPPFTGISTLPSMQFPPIAHIHLPPGQPPPMATLTPILPIPLLLPPPAAARLVAKPLSKSNDKGM